MFLYPENTSATIFVYIENLCRGTVFDGLEVVYRSNREFALFLQEFSGKLSPSFVGCQSSRFTEKRFPSSNLREHLDRSSRVDFIDYLYFLDEYVRFVREQLSKECENDDEVIEKLNNFNTKRGATEFRMLEKLQDKYSSFSSDSEDYVILDYLEDIQTLINLQIRSLRRSN